MKKIINIILLFFTLNVYSQDRSQWSRSSSSQNFQIPNMVVKGKLIDSESNDGLSYATISVITADSILRISPPTSVQANPVTTPILFSSSISP